MSRQDPILWYDNHVKDVVAAYEAFSFADIHSWLLPLLSEPQGKLVLDIGAGSGRDAAWFAEQGYEVIAVEPSDGMRSAARSRHTDPRIQWIEDRLPALAHASRLGTAFDIILLSAVWMHVAPAERGRAFRKIVNLLKPGALIAFTLRHGPAEPERGMYPASCDEIERLARAHGAFVEYSAEESDRSGRTGVSWTNIAVRLPDDGTGALPLLRHIVLNDAKSSTYKLALLRTLCRIADGTSGMARDAGDEHVSLPLGLVALTWVRLFHPLITNDLPQAPRLTDGRGLSFVGDGFRATLSLAAGDLRIGMRFGGQDARALHAALRDARQTIVAQPVNFMTYPNGGKILLPVSRRMGRDPEQFVIDEPYLVAFGELRVPRNLWTALQRFSVWIEPAIVSEWQRMIRDYAAACGRKIDEIRMEEAMTWSDPVRDVQLTRERARELIEAGAKVSCVWTGKALTPANLDIDHCFPWAASPCSDLWNLMPAHRDVNRSKGSRLPDARTLLSASDRIQKWWNEGYREARNPLIPERFVREVLASLPVIDAEPAPSLDDILDAVNVRRLRLKHDQQVPEWSHG